MSKDKGKKIKRNESVGNVWTLLPVVALLSLGALIGREIHRYEVRYTDDIRIKQLIEALEKKPVELKVYPLVPFRVPDRSKDKITFKLDYLKESTGWVLSPRIVTHNS